MAHHSNTSHPAHPTAYPHLSYNIRIAARCALLHRRARSLLRLWLRAERTRENADQRRRIILRHLRAIHQACHDGVQVMGFSTRIGFRLM